MWSPHLPKVNGWGPRQIGWGWSGADTEKALAAQLLVAMDSPPQAALGWWTEHSHTKKLLVFRE